MIQATIMMPGTMYNIKGAGSKKKMATSSPDKLGRKATEEIMIKIKPLFLFFEVMSLIITAVIFVRVFRYPPHIPRAVIH